MNAKTVSVAEGKKSFTQLLRQVEEENTAVLILRRGQPIGALLPADEYERLKRFQAYFEALEVSRRLAHLPISATELAEESRQELEERV